MLDPLVLLVLLSLQGRWGMTTHIGPQVLLNQAGGRRVSDGCVRQTLCHVWQIGDARSLHAVVPCPPFRCAHCVTGTPPQWQDRTSTSPPRSHQYANPILGWAQALQQATARATEVLCALLACPRTCWDGCRAEEDAPTLFPQKTVPTWTLGK